MHVVILGGSGFIGTTLSRVLLERGDTVTVSTRSARRQSTDPNLRYVRWNGRSPETLGDVLRGADAVVNLLGENIASGRWTSDRKERILQSRVKAGQALTDALREASSVGAPRPQCLIQGSAVGYYGFWDDTAEAPSCTEASPAGGGFLAHTALAWENSTREAEAMGLRRCVIRTAPVLGPGGGMLQKLAPVFRWYLGGAVGSGRQPFAWIHLDDEVDAIVFLLNHPELSGVFNLVAPQQISMRDFARAFGQALHRPSRLNVPSFILRLALGEMAEELILAGQKAAPAHLLGSGFAFRQPEIGPALASAFAG